VPPKISGSSLTPTVSVLARQRPSTSGSPTLMATDGRPKATFRRESPCAPSAACALDWIRPRYWVDIDEQRHDGHTRKEQGDDGGRDEREFPCRACQTGILPERSPNSMTRRCAELRAKSAGLLKHTVGLRLSIRPVGTSSRLPYYMDCVPACARFRTQSSHNTRIHWRMKMPSTRREEIRNIAIIAHVDHGKTTLVDAMLWQSGTFRVNAHVAERVMDSNPLEREKGITIMAKNTAIHYEGVTSTSWTTPGSRRFRRRGRARAHHGRRRAPARGRLRGSVAADPVCPEKGHRGGTAADDRSSTRSTAPTRGPGKSSTRSTTCSSTWTRRDQLDFPVLYTNARAGTCRTSAEASGETNLIPLFQQIIKTVPPPVYDEEMPLQMLVANLGLQRLCRAPGGSLACSTAG